MCNRKILSFGSFFKYILPFENGLKAFSHQRKKYDFFF